MLSSDVLLAPKRTRLLAEPAALEPAEGEAMPDLPEQPINNTVTANATRVRDGPTGIFAGQLPSGRSSAAVVKYSQARASGPSAS